MKKGDFINMIDGFKNIIDKVIAEEKNKNKGGQNHDENNNSNSSRQKKNEMLDDRKKIAIAYVKMIDGEKAVGWIQKALESKGLMYAIWRMKNSKNYTKS